MSTCIKQTKSTSAIKNMPSDNASMACFYYLAHGTDGSVTVKTGSKHYQNNTSVNSTNSTNI